MAKKTTIGQITFDDLFASLQNQTETQALDCVEVNWESMFDEELDVATTSKAVTEAVENELVTEPSAKFDAELALEPDVEPENVLNIRTRNGKARVFAPKSEPIISVLVNERITANVQALTVLEKLSTANEYATEQEQSQLAAYTGWEGIPVDEMKNHSLTDDEIEQIGTLPAYPYAISELAAMALNKTLGTIGFKSGNILVSGIGNGTLLRAIPKKMRKESRVTIDATDDINGDISSFLFPNLEVIGNGEAVNENFYDVSISVVPVNPTGTSRIVGKRGYIELPNFATTFVRSLSAIRNGGFAVMMIESRIVDAMKPQETPFNLSTAPLNFVGGMRFDKDALGNGIGYDFLVFNKVSKREASEKQLTAKRVGKSANNGSNFIVSHYFMWNNETIIGEDLEYANGQVCASQVDSATQHKKVGGAIKFWQCQDIYKDVETDSDTESGDSLPAYPNVKNYSMCMIGEDLYQRIDSRMIKQKITGRALQRVKGMISLRNQTRKLIEMQIADCTDEALEVAQFKLNHLYDAFFKEFGALSSGTNLRLFREDADVTMLAALEYMDDEDVIHKSDIFTKRTFKVRASITSCDTPQEAYTLCLDHKGYVSTSYMATLCSKSEDEIINAISGTLIFKNPVADCDENAWVAADEYLSGTVVQKLEDAQCAASHYSEYEANVKALEAVQPSLIPSEDIDISLSSRLLSEELLKQFLSEVICGYPTGKIMTFGFKKFSKGSIKINPTFYISSSDPRVHSKYGLSGKYNAFWIVEHLVNNSPIAATMDGLDANGNPAKVLDKDTTIELLEKAELIHNEFQDWIYSDGKREAEIVAQYNAQFNSFVLPKYDGSHLNFPGMSASVHLKAHQKNGVYRIIRENGGLIGHVVGAGKTITLLTAGMELKRLGRISKPLYLVPNNLLAQWGGEMMRLYPTANILLAEPDDMQKHRRTRFLSRIATGDYDAVILGSSAFMQIPAPSSVVEKTVHWQATREFEVRKKNSKQKNCRYSSGKATDFVTPRMQEDVLKTFMRNQTADFTLEELGIDYMFVDESHAYKNLYSGSTGGKVRGLTNTGAAKSSDLYYKTKYLNALHGGKGGFTFATGTAIVNSITELFSLQRYFQEDVLYDKGIVSLSDWISMFGNVTSEWELPPEGLNENGEGFRQVTRVSSFKNVPELMKMVLQFLDCVTRDEIDMETPTPIRKTIDCEPSDLQKEYMKQLVERANNIRKGKVKNTQDNMLTVTVDGRKSALDIRIVVPHADGDSCGKVASCAKEIISIYDEYRHIRGTQIVFSDISTPNQKRFHVYGALKDELVRLGMPKDEIAFAHDFKTDRQRTSMRTKMQTGNIRVLIGSTETIGQGVNIQNRLIALHNLDTPWVPKDIEQREGRIIRPGNMNASVRLYNYVTVGSFDGFMWQTIELKAKLISQVLRGDFSQRRIEEVDTKVLSYSEVKAIASGDMRFLQRAKLEGEIARLSTLKRRHDDQLKKLKQDANRNLPQSIEFLNSLICKIKEDIATIEKYTGQTVFTFNGTQYNLDSKTQREQAIDALKTSKVLLRAMPDSKIGSINGLDIMLVKANTWYGSNNMFPVLQGKVIHRNDNDATIYGVERFLSFVTKLVSNIPKSLDEKQEKLRANEVALTTALAMANEPFDSEAQLCKLKDEYNQITASLKAS